jgi:hypothetical protein
MQHFVSRCRSGATGSHRAVGGCRNGAGDTATVLLTYEPRRRRGECGKGRLMSRPSRSSPFRRLYRKYWSCSALRLPQPEFDDGRTVEHPRRMGYVLRHGLRWSEPSNRVHLRRAHGTLCRRAARACPRCRNPATNDIGRTTRLPTNAAAPAEGYPDRSIHRSSRHSHTNAGLTRIRSGRLRSHLSSALGFFPHSSRHAARVRLPTRREPAAAG